MFASNSQSRPLVNPLVWFVLFLPRFDAFRGVANDDRAPVLALVEKGNGVVFPAKAARAAIGVVILMVGHVSWLRPAHAIGAHYRTCGLMA